MKICFLARPSFDRYSVAIINNLRQKHDSKIEGCFITSNKSESKYIRDNIDNAEIYETSSFLKTNWDTYSLEKLVEYEKKYECAPIWKYIYTDRFLINRDYDYVVKVTVGLFSFFENIFCTGKIDFYYSETIATLQCYVAYIVGKKYGVKYIAQMCARGRLDSTFHYFVKDAFQYNSRLDLNYLDIEYSEDELEYADKVLKEFEQKDCPPPAMQMVRTKPRIDKQFLLAPLKYIKGRFDKELNDPYSYMYYQGYKSLLDPIVFYIHYQKCKKYYTEADFDEKFVYYPLHYQPEASTCVCAQKYEKQLFYIDNLAKSLPADTKLYVKEHYALIGHRDPHFYIELQKYPNVKLINPWESSRKLIEASVAVATLTGTAGLEAMLLRKPVFVCGNAVYETAPGVIKLDDIYDHYLENIENWKRPSREDVIKYLCACIRSYSKGNAYAQNYYDLIEDNIDDICVSLYTELQYEMRTTSERCCMS